jgi:hypothetical protein
MADVQTTEVDANFSALNIAYINFSIYKKYKILHNISSHDMASKQILQ